MTQIAASLIADQIVCPAERLLIAAPATAKIPASIALMIYASR